MDGDMLRDAHGCIFNYLANLKMEKNISLWWMFLLDFFFFNKAKNIFI